MYLVEKTPEGFHTARFLVEQRAPMARPDEPVYALGSTMVAQSTTPDRAIQKLEAMVTEASVKLF